MVMTTCMRSGDCSCSNAVQAAYEQITHKVFASFHIRTSLIAEHKVRSLGIEVSVHSCVYHVSSSIYCRFTVDQCGVVAFFSSLYQGRTAAEVAAATAATLNTLMATTADNADDKQAAKVCKTR